MFNLKSLILQQRPQRSLAYVKKNKIGYIFFNSTCGEFKVQQLLQKKKEDLSLFEIFEICGFSNNNVVFYKRIIEVGKLIFFLENFKKELHCEYVLIIFSKKKIKKGITRL